MAPLDPTLLTSFARKYTWWMTPEEAITMPERIVAHVMNIGDYDDVQALATLVGDDYLRTVLRRAEIGQFTPPLMGLLALPARACRTGPCSGHARANSFMIRTFTPRLNILPTAQRQVWPVLSHASQLSIDTRYHHGLVPRVTN